MFRWLFETPKSWGHGVRQGYVAGMLFAGLLGSGLCLLYLAFNWMGS